MRTSGVMIIKKDNLFVGVKRRFDKQRFSLLGGKGESNETTEQTAIREALEESGLRVISCKHIYTEICKANDNDLVPKEDFITAVYFATLYTGDILHSNEGEVVLLTKEQLCDPITSAFPEYNKKLFEIFDSMNLNDSEFASNSKIQFMTNV